MTGIFFQTKISSVLDHSFPIQLACFAYFQKHNGFHFCFSFVADLRVYHILFIRWSSAYTDAGFQADHSNVLLSLHWNDNLPFIQCDNAHRLGLLGWQWVLLSGQICCQVAYFMQRLHYIFMLLQVTLSIWRCMSHFICVLCPIELLQLDLPILNYVWVNLYSFCTLSWRWVICISDWDFFVVDVNY